jgi:hypothetical protein
LALGSASPRLAQHLVSGRLCGAGGVHRGEDPLGVRSVEFLGASAGHELGEQGVQAAGCAVPGAAEVEVTFGQQAQGLDVVGRLDGRQLRGAQRGHGDRRTSLGSFLFECPEPSSRIRAANVAGTSSTVSRAATSCWDIR